MIKCLINSFFKNSIKQINNRAMSNSSRLKIFVTQPIPQQAVEVLTSSGQVDLVINKDLPLKKDLLFEAIKDTDGLFCTLNEKVDESILNNAPNLKVIATCSVGYDHIDLSTCNKKGIKVGYTPGVLTDATAEYTIGLLLNTSRRISEAIAAAENDEWGAWNISWMCGQGLSGSTIGILGLGRIGLAIGKRLMNFDSRQIIYHNRSENPKAKEFGFQYVDLNTLLKESDFLICTCALTEETKNLFNLDTFKKMKKNAIFINVARGSMVNQKDLYTALKENVISAAGLDVTTPEPLPSNHELYSLKNCFISPHICSAETQTRTKMAIITATNLIEALNNRPMLHQINS